MTTPEDFARCRAMRHRFDPVIAPLRRRRNMFGQLIIFRCDYCATLRFDVVSRLTGQLLGRHYEHPLGYKDTGHHDAAYWRSSYWDTLDKEYFTDLEEIERREAKAKAKAKGKKTA